MVINRANCARKELEFREIRGPGFRKNRFTELPKG